MMLEATGIVRTAAESAPIPDSLTGAARAFYEAEQRLFAHHGLSPTSRFIRIDDPPMRVRVLEVGEGPPALMVHGGGGMVSLWASLLPQLSGRRLIAVDRPGHGLTDAFDYRGVDARRHAVSFLSSIASALGLARVPVVANSMGGLWALWLAVDRPELVSGLALLGWPALLLDTSAPFPMRLLAIRGLGARMMKAQKPTAAQARTIFASLGHGPVLDRLSPLLFDCFAAGEAMPAYVPAYQSLLNAGLRLRGARPGQGMTQDELLDVRQPVLLVVGRRDPFTTPDVARQGASAFPRARFIQTDGGHLPWLDDPTLCAAEVTAFLGGLD